MIFAFGFASWLRLLCEIRYVASIPKVFARYKQAETKEIKLYYWTSKVLKPAKEVNHFSMTKKIILSSNTIIIDLLTIKGNFST